MSDATGETLNSVTRAAVAQFQHATIIYHRWSLIRTRFQLHRVLEGIELESGPVFSTLVDIGLREELALACDRLGVVLLHVLDPALALLQEHLGEKAVSRPGRQYVLDADYFRRIDAMHFVLAHDDGQALRGVADADVCLVGVSRSSKTPTSFYLANRGIKAANIPLIPDVTREDLLDALNCPVIGLTIEADVLIEIRRHRLRMLAPTQASTSYIRHEVMEYTDPDAVKAELLWARRLCARCGWPVIDVTRRSIEETAATIIQFMESWQCRKARDDSE